MRDARRENANGGHQTSKPPSNRKPRPSRPSTEAEAGAVDEVAGEAEVAERAEEGGMEAAEFDAVGRQWQPHPRQQAVRIDAGQGEG